MHKHKRLILALCIFVLLLLSIAIFIQRQYTVPIFMYHMIDPAASNETRFSVTPDTFKSQISFLKKHHYNVLPLEECAILIKNKKNMPPRTVAITLDDGYKDNYVYAFPILKKYNLPATIFIIIDFVGMEDRLNWDEIKTMQDSDIITFGSHTLTHPYLGEIESVDELKKEIFDSKKFLEKKLKQDVNSFSYPYGSFNYNVKRLVKEAGYMLAVDINSTENYTTDDLFALKRIEISEKEKNLFRFWLKTLGFYNYFSYIRERLHNYLKLN